MESVNMNVAGLGIALIVSAAGLLGLHWHWQRRFDGLQQQVARHSEDLLQMAELQVEAYKRFNRHLTEVEERVFNLALPSADSALPLERRRQVVTLAKKGMGAGEIASRLNMPKGEAELILNLRRFMDSNEVGIPKSGGSRIALSCAEPPIGTPATGLALAAPPGSPDTGQRLPAAMGKSCRTASGS